MWANCHLPDKVRLDARMTEKSILMITGVPGSGKTTLMKPLIESIQEHQIKVKSLDEYAHVYAWSQLQESQRWLLPSEGSFDIAPSGYHKMSEYVGRSLAQEIDSELKEGTQVVVFETARGVGEPRVDYRHLVDSIAQNLMHDPSQINLLNIEVRAQAQVIEERIKARYRQDSETAPPPGTEKKYLNFEGQPLCLASWDLQLTALKFLLVFNQVIYNGRHGEDLEHRVEDEIFPRMKEVLAVEYSGSEGNIFWGGKERI